MPSFWLYFFNISFSVLGKKKMPLKNSFSIDFKGGLKVGLPFLQSLYVKKIEAACLYRVYHETFLRYN